MPLNHPCFVDVLYTGTADGKIVKIEGKNIHVLATLGKPPCGKKTNNTGPFPQTLRNVGFQQK